MVYITYVDNFQVPNFSLVSGKDILMFLSSFSLGTIFQIFGARNEIISVSQKKHSLHLVN